jgi:hypothetical protein
MLPELLLRDLTLHRRVLLAAAFTPLLLLVSVALTRGQESRDFAAMHLVFGLMLVSLLPLSLQIREERLGTLGELLALPVARRDIVRLRFLQGLLACLCFCLLHMLCWVGIHRPALGVVAEVFLSPALLWFLAIFLAYPLPFAFRWGAKGVLGAFILLISGCMVWLFLVVVGPGIYGYQWMRIFPRSVEWIQKATGAYGSWFGTWGLPILLLGGFYRLSLWAFDRVDG